jgi:hypothetical protein
VLADLREKLKPFYSEADRPSIDPELMTAIPAQNRGSRHVRHLPRPRGQERLCPCDIALRGVQRQLREALGKPEFSLGRRSGARHHG